MVILMLLLNPLQFKYTNIYLSSLSGLGFGFGLWREKGKNVSYLFIIIIATAQRIHAEF